MTSAGSSTGDAASGESEDPKNRSGHKTGHRQKKSSNTWNNEAESSQDHSISKNSFAENFELGEFVCARDSPKEVSNNIPGSKSSKSDDIMLGEFDTDDFIDGDYIAGLLDLDAQELISGARSCSFSCCKAPTEIGRLLQFRQALFRTLSALVLTHQAK